MASQRLLHEYISVPEDVAGERNKLVSVVIPTYNRAELVDALYTVSYRKLTRIWK